MTIPLQEAKELPKVKLFLESMSGNSETLSLERILMKNGEVNTFLIYTVVLSIAAGMGITLIQTGYSWSTHMTFHNLADNASELSIVAASSCTAQVNTNC